LNSKFEMLKDHELMIVKTCTDKYKESKVKLKRELGKMQEVLKSKEQEVQSLLDKGVRVGKEADDLRNELERKEQKVQQWK
jgi:predicted  nucleic acid-binding Zn-ribbon protein